MGLACAEQTFPPFWHQHTKPLGARSRQSRLAEQFHVSHELAMNFLPVSLQATPWGEGAIQPHWLCGCSGLPHPRTWMGGRSQGHETAECWACSPLPNRLSQPRKAFAGRAHCERCQNLKKDTNPQVSLGSVDQKSRMGLILADLLLTLSHSETVKTRAGDAEIEEHQYKLSLRVNALTSAGLRCKTTLTPCADVSTRKPHSFCLLFSLCCCFAAGKANKMAKPTKK